MLCRCEDILNCIKKGYSINKIRSLYNLSDKELSYLLRLLKNAGYSLKKDVYVNGDTSLSFKSTVSSIPDGAVIYSKQTDNKIRAMIVSDIHMYSAKANRQIVEKLYNYCKNNNIHVIILCGDLIDGIDKHVLPVDMQGEEFIKEYPFDSEIFNIAILGNHEVHYSDVSGKDFALLLDNNRIDFSVLGYKSGYVYMKNDYITLFHQVSGCLDNLKSGLNPHVTFLGHSHIHKIYNNNIYVPSLTGIEVTNAKNYGFFPSALDVTFSFKSDIISEICIDHLSLEKRPYILAENIIKPVYPQPNISNNFITDTYPRERVR